MQYLLNAVCTHAHVLTHTHPIPPARCPKTAPALLPTFQAPLHSAEPSSSDAPLKSGWSKGKSKLSSW